MAHFRDGNFPQDPFAPQFGGLFSKITSVVKSVARPVVSVVSTAAQTAAKTAAATVLAPTALAVKGTTAIFSRVAPHSPFAQTANAIGSAALGASAGLVPGGSTVAQAVMPTAQPATPPAWFSRSGWRSANGMPLPAVPAGYNPNQVNATNPLTPVQLLPTAQPATPTAVAQQPPPPDTSAVVTAQPAEPTTVAVPSPAVVAPTASGGGGGAILAGAGAGFLVGGPVGALVGGGIAAYLGKKS